jgi:hypothetical protein
MIIATQMFFEMFLFIIYYFPFFYKKYFEKLSLLSMVIFTLRIVSRVSLDMLKH